MEREFKVELKLRKGVADGLVLYRPHIHIPKEIVKEFAWKETTKLKLVVDSEKRKLIVEEVGNTDG